MAGYDGKVPFKPRKRFEDFTTDPELVNELKRLYKSPDEVDIMVGQEIDEEWWPHAHIPKSMLIVSFYTLFKASLTDRFVPYVETRTRERLVFRLIFRPSPRQT